MAGIAGILKSNKKEYVENMLDSIMHRGGYGREIFEMENATIGVVWANHEDERIKELMEKRIFRDGPGYGHSAELSRVNNHWEFHRDELGVAPLYIAHDEEQTILFASEVKALLPVSNDISEILPGHSFAEKGIEQYFVLEKKNSFYSDPNVIAKDLRSVLMASVQRRINSDTMGAWLSGGLDSSTIAALARPFVRTLHTFAGGLKNAPDLKFARDVATYIGASHHEVIMTLDSMLRILPDVIFQLESFDALLVRSSIVNLSVSFAASEYVSEVFSGEGGDELFAGYEYLKHIPISELDDELINIIGNLHNTALQRVDRSASAFGITAHVVFSDPLVLDYALRIPIGFKLKDGVEKWILRQAMADYLPISVLTRSKSKFWEGAGVGNLLSDYAEGKITDRDFRHERNLKNGSTLNTKEELFYYRIFKGFFGELDNLAWMGRTKGSPIS